MMAKKFSREETSLRITSPLVYRKSKTHELHHLQYRISIIKTIACAVIFLMLQRDSP